MTQIPPIRSIIAFESAARLGSFKLAAEALAISPSAISHNINTLEQYLGMRLFIRRARSVSLTDAGYKYSLLIGQFTKNLEWATREIALMREFETVTIQALPAFASSWLSPRLRWFCSEHPEIDIQLRVSQDTANFIDDGVDVAFGYTETLTTSSSYFELTLFDEQFLPYVNPDYWNDLPGKRDEEKLSNAVLIHSDRNLISWKVWLERNGLFHPRIKQGPHFDQSYLALDIAAQGWGIALESNVYAHRFIETGILVEKMPDKSWRHKGHAHKIITPQGNQLVPKIKKLIDFIMNTL